MISLGYIRNFLKSNNIEIDDVEVLSNMFESLGNQQEIKKIYVHINEYFSDKELEYSIWKNNEGKLELSWYRGNLVDKKDVENQREMLEGNRNNRKPLMIEEGVFKIIIPIITRENVDGFLCIHHKIEKNKDWKEVYLVSNLLRFIFNYYDLINETQGHTTTDFVTGLYNKRHFHMQANMDIEKVKRFKKPLVSVGIRIKDFEKIITKLGYEGSEIVLREFSDILSMTTRLTDMPARLGEERFGILMYETNSSGAKVFLNRLNNLLVEEKIEVNGVKFNLEIETRVIEYRKDMLAEEIVRETGNF